jgi:tRNA 2-thiouridine synthesizing protein A
MKADATLDCYGLQCPMPLIQTSKKIKELEPGQVLEILSTDPGIRTDMPAWCRKMGQEFLGVEEDGDVIKAYARKTAENSQGEP